MVLRPSFRSHARRSLGLTNLPIPETLHHMVVHHSRSLHQRVTDGRAHKFKPALGKIFAHGIRFPGACRNVVQRTPLVLYRTAAHKLPDISVEASELFLNGEKLLRVPDGRTRSLACCARFPRLPATASLCLHRSGPRPARRSCRTRAGSLRAYSELSTSSGLLARLPGSGTQIALGRRAAERPIRCRGTRCPLRSGPIHIGAVGNCEAEDRISYFLSSWGRLKVSGSFAGPSVQWPTSVPLVRSPS